MKVLFSGGSICDLETMQRLLLIADEVAFMDRPSVAFGNWGLVGHESEVRRLQMPSDSPVALVAHKPPWGRAEFLYQKYVDEDLRNPAFVSTFLQGLRESSRFASKFIAVDAGYSTGKGHQILAALNSDESLATADLSGRAEGGFEWESADGRRETLKSLLCECSVQVTAAMAVSARTDLLPVADDPFLCRLLATRAADKKYVSSTPVVSGVLGLAMAQAVLPDEILRDLTFADIIDYRKEAKEAYASFSTEVDRLAVRILNADPAHLDDEIKSILASEVNPRVRAYRNEMCTVRDRMFGSLIKKVIKWELPTLTLAQWVGVSWSTALTAFVGALIPAVGPDLVDYVVGTRDVARKNALAYLVAVAPDVSGVRAV
jgi:hypothetical protein